MEVLVDPPGADGSNEYVELFGPPGSDTSGLWLVAVEGDTNQGKTGDLDLKLDLSKACDGPCRFGDNGLLLLTPEGGRSPQDALTTASTALPKGALENGTATLLLLSASAPPAADLDVDDDGTLELAAGTTVLDAIAWTDATAGDRTYAPTLPRRVHALLRWCDRTQSADATAWAGGYVDPESSELRFLDGEWSGPGPAATLSPGALNPPLPISTEPGAAGATGAAGNVGGAGTTGTAGGAETAGEHSVPLTAGAAGTAGTSPTATDGGCHWEIAASAAGAPATQGSSAGAAGALPSVAAGAAGLSLGSPHTEPGPEPLPAAPEGTTKEVTAEEAPTHRAAPGGCAVTHRDAGAHRPQAPWAALALTLTIAWKFGRRRPRRGQPAPQFGLLPLRSGVSLGREAGESKTPCRTEQSGMSVSVTSGLAAP